MFGRHKWGFVGYFCKNHLHKVLLYYGTLKVEVLDVTSVPGDVTCDVFDCKEKPMYQAQVELK